MHCATFRAAIVARLHRVALNDEVTFKKEDLFWPSVAMMGKMPYTVLKDAVFAHPTLAESLNNLFGHFQG